MVVRLPARITLRGLPLIAMLVCNVGMVAATPACRADDIDKEELERIRGVLVQQAKAWNQFDLDGFMDTYWRSEQLSFSSGGQTTRGWKETKQRYERRYSDPAKMGQLRFSNLEINALGTDSAFVLGRWHLKRAEDEMEGNFTLILRKIKGDWKIIHDHTSLEEEASE